MMAKNKRKEEWWIYYRMAHSEYEDDQVVVLPSVGKLLWWIAKFGNRCCQVEIVLREG